MCFCRYPVTARSVFAEKNSAKPIFSLPPRKLRAIFLSVEKDTQTKGQRGKQRRNKGTKRKKEEKNGQIMNIRKEKLTKI
jgi:hypothetical protein